MTDRDPTRQTGRQVGARPPREPLLNAPPLAILIPVMLITLYGLQALLPPEAQGGVIDSFGLSPLLLRNGDYELLVTYIFLHGGWVHVLMNSVFCLAFATPLVRIMAHGVGGVVSYLAFFLVCGVVAGLGYCLLNWHSPVPVVGASGAIAGLVGAAIRLPERGGEGGLKPLWDMRVIVMTLTWCLFNVATAFVPVSMGGEMTVAWQAHVVGYLFGLIAISPWLALFHRRAFTTN